MRQKVLFILGFLLTLPAIARDFDYTYEGQTITYTVIDEEAKTVKTKEGEFNGGYLNPGNKVSGALILPSVVFDGDAEYTLTKIGNSAFYGCIGLTSVTIPNSVKTIGNSAFYSCSGLTSVTIPNSVKTIGYSAFYSCSGLTSVEIPNSVTSIGEGAFKYCSGLTSVEIPNSVTSIGEWAFYYCSGLTSVEIPNSVTSIGNSAFYSCSGLTSVEIPNSVKTIGNSAFSDCISLTSVEIPNSVTSIGNSAFRSCSGLTSVEIPNSVTSIGEWAFYSCSGLTSVVLGEKVEYLGNRAFASCKSLSEIISYAVEPPDVGSSTFSNIASSCVLIVPFPSIDLYKDAPGWKKFYIRPIIGYSISVSLPSDAKDGRYKNMSIELLNSSNGQRYKYLITDKTEYVFGNLSSSTKYSVSIKNAKNEVLGEISDLEIVDKDLTVSFQSLRQPKNVTVKVVTPDEADITSDVTIKWYNDANELLQQEPTIQGVLENSCLSYVVVLPTQLQNIYIQPSAQTIKVSERNDLVCKLENIGKTIITGKVCDKDGKAISTAYITASQNINGSYSNSVNVQCDNDGTYKFEISDVPLKVTIAANGYIGQTKELQTASMGIGDVMLEKITGLTISPSYIFRESVATRAAASESDRFTDDANIAYRIEDKEGNEIADCIYQPGSIVLPETIEIGDELNVVAYSKNNRFGDASQRVILNSKHTNVTLTIVEYGRLQITTDDDAAMSGICILYDASGKQVGKSTFRGNNISFGNLPDGQYTVVAMRKSSLLGSVMNLSSLQETQLEQGRDYLLNKVDVVSGQISDLEIENIPELDETKLYYTNSKETYFMPNKSQLTIGKYLTLSAKFTVKDEYAPVIDAAALVVDIPSGCEFVDYSVISGTGYMGYEYANNRLSILVHNISDVVRFCIVPLEGGECKLSAFVKLVIDNKEILQPIGSAYFEANKFSLSVPKKTSKTNIPISGTAMPDSEVLVYDNDVLVGSTYSMPNGQWSMNISLYKPYSKSIHNLYGEVITRDGKRLLTQSKTVDYDQAYVDLSKVTMVYNNTNIVFDHLNGRNTAKSYSYSPIITDFTFIADFAENNSEKISNVVIKVLASDGSVRSLPADYNPATGNWMAQTKYADSHKLPVNATALFDINKNESVDISRIEDEIRFILHDLSGIPDEVNNDFIHILNSNEQNLEFSYFNDDINTPLFVTSYIDETVNIEDLTNSLTVIEIPDEDTSTSLCLCDEIADNGDYFIHFWGSNETDIVTIKMSLTDTANTGQVRSPALVGLAVGGAISIAGAYFSRQDYIKACEEIRQLYYQYRQLSQLLEQRVQTLYNMLNARCNDGSNKISITQAYQLTGKIQSFHKYILALIDGVDKQISQNQQLINQAYGWTIGLSLVTALGKWGIGTANITGKILNKLVWGQRFLNVVEKSYVLNSLGSASGGLIDNALINAFFGNNRNGEIEALINGYHQELDTEYTEVANFIRSAYKECPKDDDDNDDNNDDFPTPPITPSSDPSGYVYEAVPSNRIASATATVYFKQQTEDMYGDITETEVVWDAAPFGQENPLTTDAQGMYAWDVPAGMWQVRFEKEGYEPAQSAWLPVPPPQLDVNIAMTQVKQPEVKAVHAYSDGVTIEFDKFMLPSTLTFGNISITQNGNVINGVIETSDIEFDVNGNAFCSKVEYKPSQPLEEGEATVFVSKSVKSYADINMSEDFNQSFTVEPRISKINVVENIDISSGSTVRLSATVLPATAAKGKTVLIGSLNQIIATVSTESVEIDSDGNIVFDVTGLVLGKTNINLSVEGYDIETTIVVNVTAPRDKNQVATPYASVESGKVAVGTEIYLYCETDNASIYYTVDGSCPCDVNRLRYDGTPIVVDKDFTLKVMAEADGMAESEIAEYQYTAVSAGVEEISIDRDLRIYPLPLGEYLNISNGNYIIDTATLYDMDGNRVVQSAKSEKHVSLKVDALTPGIYILNVRSNGKSIVYKVIKR